MTADSALPVWSIRPNWQNGIVETLEWLSDVLRGSYGTEQVRALRLSPRRTFEMTFNPLEQERTFFDLWLHRMSANEFMLPLFHDHGLTSADINAGATSIPLDTTYREFEVGGLAILLGGDAFTFDKVTIEAIAADSITVTAGGVTRAWAAGTSILPLRRAMLQDQSNSESITDTLGQAALRFELNQENDIADEGTWDVMYGAYPVILEEPNRRENIKVTFGLETIKVDNDVGLRTLTDDAGRAFTLQTHTTMMVGRAEHWAFRQMLYRLRGQQGGVWIPTFNGDIELARDHVATDSLLDIKQIGYSYTGGVVGGRAYLLINGAITRQITGIGGAPSSSEEQLLLDSALGTDLPAGTIASFMDTCRLGSDSIQITHLTDTDGVAEGSLSFRAFRDERTTPDPISQPIPTAAVGVDSCGTAAADEAGCVGVDYGYWGKISVNTSLGPNVPVVQPWSWQINLLDGATQQVLVLNSDGIATYNGGTGKKADGTYDYLNGWSVVMDTSKWQTNPFASASPNKLTLAIQWPYSNVIFPGDSTFSGDHGDMTITVDWLGPDGLTKSFTTPVFAGVAGLWPENFSWDIPA